MVADGQQNGADASAPAPAQTAFVNTRIADTTVRMAGMSTHTPDTHNPHLDDGNLACAYAVKTVLQTAIGQTFGTNPIGVEGVSQGLLQQHITCQSTIDAEPLRLYPFGIKLAVGDLSKAMSSLCIDLMREPQPVDAIDVAALIAATKILDRSGHWGN